MIVYDVEVFPHNWLFVALDCTSREFIIIKDDVKQLKAFYKKYHKEIWVGFNSSNYDLWIVKGILCGFNPYEISQFIIVKERRGYEFSDLLWKNYRILNYDCMIDQNKSLKQLEGFMGHDIEELDIPWDLDRFLTEKEWEQVIHYCKYDVWETFNVFVETKKEFESHIGLIKEFNLPLYNITKTKAQLVAIILKAERINRRDEFNITFPQILELGKYEYIKEFFTDWAINSKNYKEIKLKTEIAGVLHEFGVGGLHGAIKNYYGEGRYLLIDGTSYYPSVMIEYNFLSRNVGSKKEFKRIRDERVILKMAKDPKELPRKIVLNSTFGASKDRFNKLYDPLMANNMCINGQLFLVDLIESLENSCELIQSNTDGILVKVNSVEAENEVLRRIDKWSERTKLKLEVTNVRKVFQKDVNNYIFILENGKLYSKGAWAKENTQLDNDLPILNMALREYFVNNVPVEKTITDCNDLIQFQKICKITNLYDYCLLGDEILNGKVHRIFASKDPRADMFFKKHRNKKTKDKVANTPERCIVYNGDVSNMKVPEWLDKEWYIETVKRRIKLFI